MFLSTVHLPNLQASSILLGLAFCYDVFFVFISPYVFGSSVMVKVATGPTVAQHSDENFCEKYPTNRDCNTNTMPMLLIVPTFSSYLSSESMLGLGDIVLPGLLLVWAARLDIRSYGSLSSPYASKGDDLMSDDLTPFFPSSPSHCVFCVLVLSSPEYDHSNHQQHIYFILCNL